MSGRGEGGGFGFGQVVGNVNVHVGRRPVRPARSAYLQQVKRIAPPELFDRESELTELTAFCLDDDRGPYVWWQAGPWAGKTALLSTFVLHAPEQVRVVSYFISGHDTRDRFAAVMLEQLCELTGREMPEAGADPVRLSSLLRDGLNRAAKSCQAGGGRLVLVIDGLDEDSGVTCGPDAHSIAGLLPVGPMAGMRVIVGGRANPPVPDDVPDWHPLRDTGIIRTLTPSRYVTGLPRLAGREIKGMLKGGPLTQDLLGLFTAAGGSLSVADLRELTRAELVAVEDVLHTTAGRSLTRHATDGAPDLYSLAHQELTMAARRYLGAERLSEFEDRLHIWAERYLAPDGDRQPWPADTPEYLLRDYPRMLATTGDVDRLIAVVTDPVRHDRMRTRTGSDTVALAEIAIAQELMLARPPDLPTLVKLSIYRNAHVDRHRHLPSALPVVRAMLGDSARAEAVARNLTRQLQPAKARAVLAEAAAAAGDLALARRLAAQAETVARAQTGRLGRMVSLAEVTHAMVAAGELGRAETIARALTNEGLQAWTLAHVAKLIASRYGGLGQRLTDEAEAIARAPDRPSDFGRWSALIELAKVSAAAGDLDRTRRLASDAEELVRAQNGRNGDAEGLVDVAMIVASVGESDRARRLAADARAAALAMDNRDLRDRTLARVAVAATAAGDIDLAQDIGHSLTDDHYSWESPVSLVRAVAATGDFDRAQALAGSITHKFGAPYAQVVLVEALIAAGDLARAESLACAITDPYHQATALEALVRAVAARDVNHAETLARQIIKPYAQAKALAGLALVAGAGDADRARGLATDAEQLAQASIEADQQTHREIKWSMHGRVAEVAALAGDIDRAEQLAHEITDHHGKQHALAEVARAALALGHLNRAEAIARTVTDSFNRADALLAVIHGFCTAGDIGRAEALVEAISGSRHKAQARSCLAEAAAAAGDVDRAETHARAITVGNRHAQRYEPFLDMLNREDWETNAVADESTKALTIAAEAAAAAGDIERARTLIEAISDSYEEPKLIFGYEHPRAVVRIIAAAAAAGQIDEAEALARAMPHRDQRAVALYRVGQAVVASRYLDRARRLTGEAEALTRRTVTEPFPRAWILAAVAEAAAAAGDAAHGKHLTDEALAPGLAEPFQRAWIIAAVAQAVAASDATQARQWTSEAAAIARDITEPFQRTQALAAVAQASAAAGDLAHAETLARDITDPDELAQTLTAIAQAAAAAGDADQAGRLLGEALATGHWLVPLPVLAGLCPELALQAAAGAACSGPQATVS
ncbi:hypothetical protein RMN56_20705 [Micromonospora halotolerans]|uniref:NACHT domain-containing protein n=1 Tax=Micromonospora halotolerans TaxID=709879 RepID=A0ABY9ZQK5_9ACTN|nr:hypothetical protein [Micromonospora halotolerans]WNM37577.1 hypothetical protein RMN56_20705 [Micromonospora halotolerans]